MCKEKYEDFIMEGICSAIYDLGNSELINHGFLVATDKVSYWENNHFKDLPEESLIFSDFRGLCNLYIYQLSENKIGIFVVRGSFTRGENKVFKFNDYANFIITTEDTYIGIHECLGDFKTTHDYVRLGSYANEEFCKNCCSDPYSSNINVYEFFTTEFEKLCYSINDIYLKSDLEEVTVLFKYDNYINSIVGYEIGGTETAACSLMHRRYTYSTCRMLKKDILPYIDLNHQYKLATQIHDSRIYAEHIGKSCRDLCIDHNNIKKQSEV